MSGVAAGSIVLTLFTAVLSGCGSSPSIPAPNEVSAREALTVEPVSVTEQRGAVAVQHEPTQTAESMAGALDERLSDGFESEVASARRETASVQCCYVNAGSPPSVHCCCGTSTTYCAGGASFGGCLCAQ